MTEFNTSGFDVVDKFFGTTDDADVDGGGADVKHGGGLKNNHNNNRSRGGVGHSKTSSQSAADKKNEALRTTLLKVGRKKRSAHGTIDDDDDDNVHHQDDPDEDLGRTAIASDRPVNNEDKKGKKKLGKKERMKLMKVNEQHKNGMTKDTTSQPEINQDENKHQLEGQDDVKGEQQEQNIQQQQAQQKKKKRRKVRSRQKNIYKDNRSMEEKPSHLVPGSRDYSGRPMTHATRKRLNLPENPQSIATKRSKIENYQHSTPYSKNGVDSVDDLFVIDREPSTTLGDDDVLVGEKLAVDDLQSSDDEEDGRDDDNDQGEVIDISGSTSTIQQNGEGDDNINLPTLKSVKNREMKKEAKKRKKKTKKRFKNLM